jgi:C4-dicarboxylate transporter DctM subunit
MIVYAILAEVSIGKMFMAGILPGMLLSGIYSCLHHLPGNP